MLQLTPKDLNPINTSCRIRIHDLILHHPLQIASNAEYTLAATGELDGGSQTSDLNIIDGVDIGQNSVLAL